MTSFEIAWHCGNERHYIIVMHVHCTRCTCRSIYECMHNYIVCICTCVCVCVCACACECAWVRVCFRVFVYMHMCIYDNRPYVIPAASVTIACSAVAACCCVWPLIRVCCCGAACWVSFVYRQKTPSTSRPLCWRRTKAKIQTYTHSLSLFVFCSLRTLGVYHAVFSQFACIFFVFLS